jgi:uncharacterized membrane protein YheB (UPF0754 family)
MHLGLLLIPFLSAFIGWFTPWLAIKMLFRPRNTVNVLGFRLQGVFPKKQKQIAQSLAKMVNEEFFSLDSIEQKIADPASLEKIMPVIEEHIDHFLRVKLAKKMPIVSMFIGDKTINEMKSVFMDELSELFPVIMKNYVGGLKEQIDIEGMITEKLGNFPPEKLELIVYQGLSKELRYLGLFGATIGFIIGLAQLLIAWQL